MQYIFSNTCISKYLPLKLCIDWGTRQIDHLCLKKGALFFLEVSGVKPLEWTLRPEMSPQKVNPDPTDLQTTEKDTPHPQTFAEPEYRLLCLKRKPFSRVHDWVTTTYKLSRIKEKNWIFGCKNQTLNLLIWVSNFAIYKSHLLTCEGQNVDLLQQVQNEFGSY